MIIFCDRLTPGAAAGLLVERARRGPLDVRVLDGAPGGLAARLLGLAGIGVREADFFTGHLRMPDGEAVYVSARRCATPLIFDAVDRLLDENTVLRQANARAGRGTIRLFLARLLWADVEPVVLRILAARALADGEPCTVVLRRPATFDPVVLERAWPGTVLRWYRPAAGFRGRLALLRRALVGTLGRELRWMLTWRRPAPPAARSARPGLLLLQEDDLSMDRSVRSQPHWLHPGADAPGFDTFVLPRSRASRLPADEPALAAAGVTVLGDDLLAATRRARMRTDADRRLAAEARAALRAAAAAPRLRAAFAALAVWGLLTKARSLAAWCAQLDIRAFLTAENYTAEADAMQIVSERTGVRTVSYQYSNLPFPTPLMMTTADRLCLFSKRFAPLWAVPSAGSQTIVETGYLFDGSFALVRDRAALARRALTQAGATFVFCYFDESVQTGKYGLIDGADHREELRVLVQALLDDPSLGLIVKTQFERNSPSRLYGGDDLIAQAQATGRYLELRSGTHRNTVLPSEAALASDFAIGHIVGATAALEAALAGRRCALLNPYGMRTVQDDLYGRAQIVVPTMTDLLTTVQRMREGSASAGAFGDWTAILPPFDPWRDGRAAVRLRAELEAICAGTAVRLAAGAA